MNAGKHGFRLLDGIILVIVLSVAVFSGVRIYGHRENRVHLVIETPDGTWIYSLDTDRRLQIPGPLGNTVIEISGKKARFAESPCPNRTCISEPPISRKGEWSACLPNRVVIRIEGEKKDDGLDAIAD